MSLSRAGASPRWALAALALGLGTCLSYGGQRLVSAWWGELPMSAVIAQEHTPLYWRCGLALLHGLVLASLVGLGVRQQAAERALRLAPVLVWLVILPLALSLVAVP